MDCIVTLVFQVFLCYVTVEDMRTDVTGIDLDKLTLVASWSKNLGGLY